MWTIVCHGSWVQRIRKSGSLIFSTDGLCECIHVSLCPHGCQGGQSPCMIRGDSIAQIIHTCRIRERTLHLQISQTFSHPHWTCVETISIWIQLMQILAEGLGRYYWHSWTCKAFINWIKKRNCIAIWICYRANATWSVYIPCGTAQFYMHWQ